MTTHLIDFHHRSNRYLRLEDVPESYIRDISRLALNDPYYPTFHIAPKHGLLNDPNGLIYFNGKHHLFYQWFPLGPVHGLKHWYHLSTADFVHFEDHGIFLMPDVHDDWDGCFSGSALEEEETCIIYYTGNRKTKDGGVSQTQIRTSLEDPGNQKETIIPVPPKGCTNEFRDPFAFRKNDETYLLIGTQTEAMEGSAVIYKKSHKTFEFIGHWKTNMKNKGYMWECPVYVEHEGSGLFIFSPQGMKSTSSYDFQNVFSVVYSIGSPINTSSFEFNGESFIELDKGFDFYAPQVYQDAENRMIMVGWLGNSKSEYPTDINQWAHMLTIPRMLKIEGNELIQTPLEELKNLRHSSEQLEQKHKLKSTAFELVMTMNEEFEWKIENEKGEYVCFRSEGESYELDRSHMSELYAEAYGTKRKAVRKKKESHQIRMFIDHSSIEIFCDEGKTIFTSRFFLKNPSKLTFLGGTGEVHYLRPITME
jgi:beta-fructofuranosidase